MRCPLRSSINFDVECPYGRTICRYDIYEENFYVYEFCPFDVDENGECQAIRLNTLTGEVEIVIVEVLF
jgi:hypothetical protein